MLNQNEESDLVKENDVVAEPRNKKCIIITIVGILGAVVIIAAAFAFFKVAATSGLRHASRSLSH